MRRRDFLTGIVVSSTVPLAARAQQSGKLPTIGFLGTSTASAWSAFTTAFVRRLGELGWIEQRTVAIEYRWGQGRTERFAEIATEFVKIRADVIVTAGSAVPAIKQVTSIVPIVFAIATDPVGGGLVESLARPGGDVTGVSNQQADLAGKRVEILREAIPGLRRLAFWDQVSADQWHALKRAAGGALAMHLSGIEFHERPFDYEQALKQAAPEDRAALLVMASPLFALDRARLPEFALQHRMLSAFYTREYVDMGGFFSYGVSFTGMFRHAADYVDRIARGAKPDDLPIEQPTKYELVINLKTAKALGITVPQTMLVAADEVIE